MKLLAFFIKFIKITPFFNRDGRNWDEDIGRLAKMLEEEGRVQRDKLVFLGD